MAGPAQPGRRLWGAYRPPEEPTNEPSTPKGLTQEQLAEWAVGRAELQTGTKLSPEERNDALYAVLRQLAGGAQPLSLSDTVIKTITAQKGETSGGTSGPPGPAPTGYQWSQKWDSTTQGYVWDLVADRGTTGRSASQEAADAASAAANNAQAEAIRAKMLRDQLTDEAVRSGQLYRTQTPGVFFTPNGDLFDANDIDIKKAQLEIQQGTFDEVKRANLIKEGLDTRRAANEELATRQTGAYQQGQLGIERGRLDIERQSAAARAASEAQQNALKRNEYVSGLLGKPTDFMARVITQRGLGNPNPVTQADLINQINKEFTQLQPGQVFSPPQSPTPGNLGVPRLAMGGMVNDPMMIVGDPQMPGQPNPEVIHNPTGAPISVTPMNRLGGNMPKYAQGTPQQQPQQDPMMKEMENKVKSIGRLLQHVENPDTQHELIDEMATYKHKLGRLPKPKGPGLLDDVRGRLSMMPKYAEGTPVNRITDVERQAFGAANPGFDSQLAAFAAIDAEQQAAIAARDAAPQTPAPTAAPTTMGGSFGAAQPLPSTPYMGETYAGGEQAPVAADYDPSFDVPQPPPTPAETNKVVKQTEHEVRKAALRAYMESPEGLAELRKAALNIGGGVGAGAGQGVQGSVANIKALFNRFGIKVGKADMDLLRLPSPRTQGKIADSPAVIEARTQEMRKALEDFLSDFNPGATAGKVTAPAGRLASDASKSFDLLKQTVTGAKASGRRLTKDVLDKLDVTPRYAYGTPRYANGTGQAEGTINSGPELGLNGLPVPGGQTGSLPGGGGYYRNPDGSSGTTGNVTPEGQFLFLRQFGGLDEARARQISGVPAPVAEPEDFSVSQPVSQSQLEARADTGAASIGLSRLFGENFGKKLSTVESTPNPINTGLNSLRFQFPLLSPQQLQQMTTDELIALNSYLGLKYNTTLQDVIEAQRQVFQAPAGRRLVRR